MMMGLLSQKRTRESEAARRRLSIVDQVTLFNQNNLDDFFKRKAAVRGHARMLAMRNQVRFGGR